MSRSSAQKRRQCGIGVRARNDRDELPFVGHVQRVDSEQLARCLDSGAQHVLHRGDVGEGRAVAEALEVRGNGHTGPAQLVSSLSTDGHGGYLHRLVGALCRRAVLALAAFEGPEVDEALQAALEDKDWQTRQAAEDLLG